MTAETPSRYVVANLGEARAAIQASQARGGVAELESPPDAASIYGVLWFAEMNRLLAAEFSAASFTLTLDCGDRADLAHAALVEGLRHIRFGGQAEALRALEDIATQLGATTQSSGSPALHATLLYVIAEPEIAEADRAWIEAIRCRRDPQFGLVGPHLTFVFGTDALAPNDLVSCVNRVAAATPPIAFHLLDIVTHSNQVLDQHYVFLTSSVGRQSLVDLHDRLCAESLGEPDGGHPAFEPHVTLARFTRRSDADALVETLRGMAREIAGVVSSLRVISVAGSTRRDIATIPLGTGKYVR